MFGIVVGTSSDYAYLHVGGVSDAAIAPFSEVRNATPQVLDFAEVVSCTLHRRNGGELCAKEIRILVGKSESDGFRRMRPFADWEQGDRRTHSGTNVRRHHGAGRR
jgi:hypothetical protein